MTLMAQMHPWLRASLMDQSSSEPPSCHKFSSETGHPSGARISASLCDPRAGGNSGPPAACLAAWQEAAWHMIKVLWRWLRREIERSRRSKVNSQHQSMWGFSMPGRGIVSYYIFLAPGPFLSPSLVSLPVPTTSLVSICVTWMRCWLAPSAVRLANQMSIRCQAGRSCFWKLKLKEPAVCS